MTSIEQKVGRLMFVGFEGHEAPDYILEWLREGRIGGVYLFSRNVDTPKQVAALTRSLHAAALQPILIGIDQEGGIVARFHDGFTESPGAMALAASRDKKLARRMAQVLGAEMRALGINWVFAPVVDIVQNITNGSVGTRSLGADKNFVSEYAVAQIEGFQDFVAATAKHFPGLGKSSIDTHYALATIDDSLEYILENDMIPFKQAIEAGVETIMTTHTMFTALDSEHPATLSPVIIKRLLREELGFNGLVSTDCLEMRAITDHYGPAESAILSVLAGIDTVMFSHTKERQEAAYNAVVDAVHSGRIPESLLDEAIARIDTVTEHYAIQNDYAVEIVNSDTHVAIARDAARQGMVSIKSDPSLIPLAGDDSQKIAVVEFAFHRDTEAIERGGLTSFITRLQRRIPGVKSVALRFRDAHGMMEDRARQIARESDILILATRSTHINPIHYEMAIRVCAEAKKVILVCLRNPYDADVFPDAEVIFCTCGDSSPSLQAAVDALMGDFVPSGELSVPLGIR